MTMAAQSQPGPRDGGHHYAGVIPATAPENSESGSLRTHTRERVSEAIALVRARQAVEAQRKNTTVIDVTEYETARSPLTPAGQTGSFEMNGQHRHSRPKAAPQPSSFLMNVFASRSDVDTTPDNHEGGSVPSNEQNIPEHASSFRFVNSLGFVQREIQLATQSAINGKLATRSIGLSNAATPPASLNPMVGDLVSIDSSETAMDAQMKNDIGKFVDRLNIGSATSSGDESSESLEAPVDPKTIEEVKTFLHSLNIKESEQHKSVLERTASTESDPFEAMRRAASEDFTDGSQDDRAGDMSDGSMHGSVKLETLEEIGVYIDAITKGRASDEVVPNQRDGPSFAHPVRSVTSWPSEDAIAGKSVTVSKNESISPDEFVAKKQQGDAPSFADPIQSTASWPSEEALVSESVTVCKDASVSSCVDDAGQISIVQNQSIQSNYSTLEQRRVSKPSPIYEQVEAKSLQRGTHKDPPAAITSRNPDQLDPPATAAAATTRTSNMNEAVMRMHESLAVAPSYSVESLESEGMMIGSQNAIVEEGNKANEMDQETPELELGYEIGKKLLTGNQALSAEAGNFDDLFEEIFGSNESRVSMQIGVDETYKNGIALRLPAAPCDRTETSSMDNAHTVLPTFQVESPEADGRTSVVTTPRDQTERSSVQTHHIDLSTVPLETSVPEARDFSELLDDAGVPLRTQLSTGASDVEGGGESELTGRYDIIEADKSDDDNSLNDDESQSSDIMTDLPDTGLGRLPNSPSMKDDDSLPWDLKDIASEETMKAAGRVRPAALIPASRTKARKLKSILSDDSSVPQSEFGMSDNGGSRDGNEAESDAPNPGFAFSDLVIEDGDAGVEVGATAVSPDGRVEADEGAEQMEETKRDFAVAFPSVPSATSEDRRSPLIDPAGRLLVPTIDAAEEAADKRPDPDTVPRKVELGDRVHAHVDHRPIDNQVDHQAKNQVQPELAYDVDHDSENDFVQAFLERGSNSGDDGNGYGSVKQTSETSTNSTPSFQSHWYNPFASPSKEIATDESWHNPFLLSVNEAKDEEGLGFLEQFQSLELDNEEENDRVQGEAGPEIEFREGSLETTVTAPRNLFTLVGIARFFADLDSQFAETDNGSVAHNVRFFQRLVAPVVAGEKPSIIQAAQIRQAAIRAEVPLEVVDRFLDHTDELCQPGQQLGSNTLFGHMEQLAGDDTIYSFLARFGFGHSPNTNAWSTEGGRTDAVTEPFQFYNEAGNVKVELQIQESEEDEWWKDQELRQHDRKILHSTSDESGHVDKIFEVESDRDDDGRGEATGLSESHPGAPPTCPSQIAQAENSRVGNVTPLIVNQRYTGTYDVWDEDVWSRRNAMGHYGAGWEAHATWLSPKAGSNLRKPCQINGVEATENLRRFVFSKKIFTNHQPWKKLYRERTKFHPGFMEVDINSIYESTAVDLALQEEEDFIPWERREVQQRFLHEKSYSFARNWFGDLVRRRGNQKVKTPVCKPKSMEMPIENLPEQGEWTKEWFTQWKSPILRRSTSKSEDYTTDGSYTDGGTFSDHGTVTDRGTYTDTDHGSVTDHGTTDYDHGSCTDGSTARQNSESSFSVSERTGSSGASGSTTASWEEAPECGEIINVRLKIGERVTRVHPDFTSSLHRSRWRKKYFPRGTFPY